jgi:D-cysteine desulfhydrase
MVGLFYFQSGDTSMKTQIFKPFSHHQDLPFLPLVESPTSAYQMHQLGKILGHSELYIKREDKTSPLYGGNKVRNLEFVLGHAVSHGHKELITPVPLGSNFTAALSSEAKRLGVICHLAQFKAQVNPQIEAINQFCIDHDAQITLDEGILGPVRAVARMSKVLIGNKEMLYIPAGASNILGAAGHAKAFLEFSNQGIRPDYIVLGTGTCGTTAGLLAGIKLAGFSTKVIGVRCAHPVVCNTQKVLRLANGVLKLSNSKAKVTSKDFEIVDLKINHKYGTIAKGSAQVMKVFEQQEGLHLDTTYTAKVAIYITELLKERQFMGRKVLYWHTYSNKAFTWNQKSLKELENI